MQPLRSGQAEDTAHRDACDTGWSASLQLGWKQVQQRTILASARHCGPLRIQRPFYPERSGTAHVYLLHPPGGVAGGDQLDIEIELDERAWVLSTTPAATKFYRSAGAECEQRVRLRVARGARLEWLPQESIVFSGALARSSTRVELADGADFAGWEITCLGRPGSGERFERGHFIQKLEVWRDGIPLLTERLAARAGDPLLDARWGLGGAPVLGSFVCATSRAELLPALRERASGLSLPDGEQFSASALDGAIVCRYLGHSPTRARDLFLRAWEVLRPALHGVAPQPPRIWAT